MNNERILYGGSFDPLHLGHISGAQRIREMSGVERITFLPCLQSPHKHANTQATSAQRLKMLEIIQKEHPWVEIDRRELDREGSSYSWETIQSFQLEEPDRRIGWILGTDQWEVIETWANADYLANHVHFYVLDRQSIMQAKEGWSATRVSFDFDVSSTQIRLALHDQSNPDILERGLSPRILRYIQRSGLYR